MASMFNKLRGKVLRITGKMEQYQEAITFAEAGQPINGQPAAHEKESRQHTGKLLVVGRESIFTGK
jgi:hypothetical protein